MKDIETLLHILRDISIPAIIVIGAYIAFYAGKTYHMLMQASAEMKEFKKKACVGIQSERNRNITQNERLSVLETRVEGGICKCQAEELSRVATEFKAPEKK